MKRSLQIKISIDVIMFGILILLMAFIITGDLVHEIIGIFMISLWLIHNILNRRWYSYLTKGRYTPIRIINTVTVFALILSVTVLIISGIIISAHVFSFLNIQVGMVTAQSLHIVSAYWCFILFSFHLGLHWNQIVHLISVNRKTAPLSANKLILKILLLIACCYGIYSFINNQIISYLFMQSRFVFFDYEQSIFSFITDYISIIIMCATFSYIITVRLKAKRV